jgi:hypothetical protein
MKFHEKKNSVVKLLHVDGNERAYSFILAPFCRYIHQKWTKGYKILNYNIKQDLNR